MNHLWGKFTAIAWHKALVAMKSIQPEMCYITSGPPLQDVLCTVLWVFAGDVVIFARAAHSPWTQRFHQQMSCSGHETITFPAAYMGFTGKGSRWIYELPRGYVGLYTIIIKTFPLWEVWH